MQTTVAQVTWGMVAVRKAGFASLVPTFLRFAQTLKEHGCAPGELPTRRHGEMGTRACSSQAWANLHTNLWVWTGGLHSQPTNESNWMAWCCDSSLAEFMLVEKVHWRVIFKALSRVYDHPELAPIGQFPCWAELFQSWKGCWERPRCGCEENHEWLFTKPGLWTYPFWWNILSHLADWPQGKNARVCKRVRGIRGLPAPEWVSRSSTCTAKFLLWWHASWPPCCIWSRHGIATSANKSTQWTWTGEAPQQLFQ